MAARATLEAVALLGEFGFEFVATDQVGEPTPGRIADRLTDVIAALEDAQARGDLGAVHQATEKLKRLQQAIDVWSLLAGDLDDDSSTAETPLPPLPPTAGGSTNVEGFDRAAAGPDREFRQVTGQEAPTVPARPASDEKSGDHRR